MLEQGKDIFFRNIVPSQNVLLLDYRKYVKRVLIVFPFPSFKQILSVNMFINVCKN